MAPNRFRTAAATGSGGAAAEDSRSESSSTGRRLATTAAPLPSKGKRATTTTGGTNGGSHLRDVTSAADGAGIAAGEGGAGGIDWTTIAPRTLNAYRHAHRLPGPAPFASLYNQSMLGHPRGVGRHAPAMQRRPRREASEPAVAAAAAATVEGAEPPVVAAAPSSAGTKRRVPREQLARAVRQDFNAAAVNEAEVVTSFLYVVRNQNKRFRMRFEPGKR